MQPAAPIHRAHGMRWSQWLRDEWAPVLFVVALVTLLHHTALSPVSRLSLLVLSWTRVAISGPSAGPSAKTWLLTIDEAEFETRYRERRPLDRCELAKDLDVILEAKPRVLVIDLDLSPAPPLAAASAAEAETKCQNIIDERLKGAPPKTAVVLMRPFGAHTADLRNQKTEWMQKHLQAYIAQPEIDLGIGAAIEFTCNPNGLAETALEAQGEPVCAGRQKNQFYPLDYWQFKATVFEQTTASMGAKLPSLEKKTVFFGSRIGRADRVITPLGPSNGVVVHAARFATMQDKSSLPRFAGAINLFLDLVIALGFSWLITGFMHRYVEAARDPSPATAPRLTLMLAGFLLKSLVVLLVVLAIALGLAVFCGLITEPLLIAFGLAIDGLVIAGWAHVGKAAHTHDAQPKPWWHDRIVAIYRVSPGAAAVELARWLVFWAVVFSALNSTFFGGGH